MLSCLVLSCLVLSCLVLSCPVLSCPVLSCLVLSCLVLSAHVGTCGCAFVSGRCSQLPSEAIRRSHLAHICGILRWAAGQPGNWGTGGTHFFLFAHTQSFKSVGEPNAPLTCALMSMQHCSARTTCGQTESYDPEAAHVVIPQHMGQKGPLYEKSHTMLTQCVQPPATRSYTASRRTG